MIVLDASAAFELLARTTEGERVEERIENDQSIHAPHLLDLEVSQLLRRQVHLGTVTAVRAITLLERLRQMRIVRHGHVLYLDRIWSLGENFTAYDACYLALAEQLDATLLTCDGALSRARLHKGRIEVI